MLKNTQLNIEKEVDCMTVAAKLQMNDQILLNQMENYVEEFKRLIESDPKKAKIEAKKALRETGVTTKNGKLKKKIVSWE